MIIIKNYIYLLGITMLISCSQPTIDGTTEEAAQESIKKISESLSTEDKKEFEEGIQAIILSDIDMKELMTSKNYGEELASKGIQKLNGLSFHDVINQYSKIKSDREAEKKAQAKIEIEELYNASDKSKADAEFLNKIVVNKSQYKLNVTKYGTTDVTLTIGVTNNTDQPISRLYFNAIVESPGRSIPWIKETFNYKIPGGLEPGESDLWKLSPYGREWEVDVPKDAIMIASVYKADGADEETLYSTDQFNEKSKERLDVLLEKYPEFK